MLSKHYKREADNERRCLDVGAGIGRVSTILSEWFTEVHMIEPSDIYRQRAIQRMQDLNRPYKRVYSDTIQTFKPEHGISYDAVWI